MKSPNRDLLVLLKDDNISVSHELIDLNKYRIYHERKTVLQAIKEKELKPFVFLFNMN
jgi:hypothetical protein